MEYILQLLETLQKIHFQTYHIEIESDKMYTLPNYRISMKRSTATKTLTSFPSLNRMGGRENKMCHLQGHKQNYKQKSKNRDKLVNEPKTHCNNTFSFDSGDAYIKRALLKNKWNLLPSTQNTTAKLKWLSIAKSPHFSNLQPDQLVNHFKDSYKLTTKLGLYNMLVNPHNQVLTNQKGKGYLSVLPRSYDLGADFDAWKNDFQYTAVLNLLKKIMIHIEIQHEFTLYLKYKSICQNNINIDDHVLKTNIQSVIQKQQQLFQNCNALDNQSQRVMVNKVVFLSLLSYFVQNLQGKSISLSKVHVLLRYSKLNPPFKNFQLDYFGDQQYIGFLTHQSAILFFQIYYYCLGNYSYFLSDGLNNMWIVKANQGSRGRNIFLVDSIEQLQPYRNGGNKLVQKYIQNVWILNQADSQPNLIQSNPKMSRILNKKFDIRFWVLVKSFIPLQAHIFNQGYLRLSSQTYKLCQKYVGSTNLKPHLTNYSINYHPNVSHRKQSQQQASYLLFSEFQSYLSQMDAARDCAKRQNQPHLFAKIKQKVLFVLQQASMNWRSCQTDKNSFQLFGFDIILDQRLQPYILQCNMSPACHQRGELVELVNRMGQGLLKIIGVIDSSAEEYIINQNNSKDKLEKEQNIPTWERLPSYQIEQNWEYKHKKMDEQKRYTRNQQRGSILQQLNGINHCKELEILGLNLKKKQFLYHDSYINFIQKLIYLQKFIIQRYRSSTKRRFSKDKRKPYRSVSRVCLIVQILAKICRKRQEKWTRKFLKYTRKQLKIKQRQIFSQQKSMQLKT